MLKKSETMFREYVYDFDVDGGATGDLVMRAADGLAAALEEGVIVKDAIVLNEKAVTSGGSPTLKFGTVTDNDGFLVDVAAKVSTLNGVARAGEVDGALLFDTTADAKKAYRVSSTANDKKVVFNIGTAALTAGKLRLILELYNPGTGAGVLN